MSYIMYKKNGKRKTDFPFLLTEEEVGNLERSLRPGESFVFQNTGTHRFKTIKYKAAKVAKKKPAKKTTKK